MALGKPDRRPADPVRRDVSGDPHPGPRRLRPVRDDAGRARVPGHAQRLRTRKRIGACADRDPARGAPAIRCAAAGERGACGRAGRARPACRRLLPPAAGGRAAARPGGDLPFHSRHRDPDRAAVARARASTRSATRSRPRRQRRAITVGQRTSWRRSRRNPRSAPSPGSRSRCCSTARSGAATCAA